MLLKCQEEQTSQNDTDYWTVKTPSLGPLEMQHQEAPLSSFASPPKTPSSSLPPRPMCVCGSRAGAQEIPSRPPAGRQKGCSGGSCQTEGFLTRFYQCVTSCCHSWGLGAWGGVISCLLNTMAWLDYAPSQAVLSQTKISPAGVCYFCPAPPHRPRDVRAHSLHMGVRDGSPHFTLISADFKIPGSFGF